MEILRNGSARYAGNTGFSESSRSPGPACYADNSDSHGEVKTQMSESEARRKSTRTVPNKIVGLARGVVVFLVKTA